MLEVKNLHAKIGDKEILRGINHTINDGEIHDIIGPNGPVKSTLSRRTAHTRDCCSRSNIR